LILPLPLPQLSGVTDRRAMMLRRELLNKAYREHIQRNKTNKISSISTVNSD
jgi:predicted transposase YdaD